MGNGHTVSRHPAAPDFRILTIDPGGGVKFYDTVIQGGVGPPFTFPDPIGGGGLLNEGGVWLRDSSVVGKSGLLGGGIDNRGSAYLVNSTVSGNTGWWGGGIATSTSSTLDIRESTVSGNSAEGFSYLGSTAAGSGGGIFQDGGELLLRNSTVSGNLAEGFGGGLSCSGTVWISNSTISGNSATAFGTYSGAGGGLSVGGFGTGRTITGSTISGNSAAEGAGITGSANLNNVLIGSNTGDNCSGSFANNGGNRADDSSCGSIPDDLTGLDPVLADNGGPTLTHALLAGSNAIDLAGACGLPKDQRGALRLDGVCDSGAYEFGGCFDDTWEDDDDACPGAEIVTGVQQRRSMCDPDWFWFAANPGSTYSIETLNLVGRSSDTYMELLRRCGILLDSDDDGGEEPGASKITYTATDQDAVLDVQVTADSGAYASGSGYDIVVECIQNCPCLASGGQHLALHDDLVTTTEVYEACETIVAGPNWRVLDPGSVALRAGVSVALGDGVSIDAGATLTVEIDQAVVPLSPAARTAWEPLPSSGRR